jgi:site-specific DNA recombinase
MQVAIYARVSTSHQEKNDTIDSQLELLKRHVKSEGHELSDGHIFIDNGISGSRLDRPALDRLRDAARWGEFECVVMTSADRLARSYPHQWLLLEEFKKYGCSVSFLENPYQNSPQGQLLAQMQGMIAEYERSQILERTRRGRLHKARKGEYMPWLANTYGYRYIPRQGHVAPAVEIDPQQAMVVQDIFSWLINEQLSTRKIVIRLNHLQRPTQKQNAAWHHSTVSRILRNELYTGEGYYNKTHKTMVKKVSEGLLMEHRHIETKVGRAPEEWVRIKVPAIIDQKTFQKAQQQLQDNQQNASRSYKATSGRYLLRRRVKCGECGLSMVSSRQKREHSFYLYYICTAHKDPAKGLNKVKCPSKHIRAEQLDEIVWETIKALLEHPQALQKEYELWQQVQYRQGGAFKELLQRFHTQANGLKKQEQKLIDAYQQEVISLEELSTRRQQIQLRLKALDQEKREILEQQRAALKWDLFLENMEEFKRIMGKNLLELSFQERQAITQLLVEKVVCYSDGKVDVYHILPFEEKPVTDDQKKKVTAKHFYLLRLNCPRNRGGSLVSPRLRGD